MKKQACVLITILLGCLFTLGFASAETALKPRPQNLRWTMGGGPPGSVKHLKQELLAQAMEKQYPDWHLDLRAGTEVTTQFVMMKRGEMDISATATSLLISNRKKYDLALLAPVDEAPATLYLFKKVPISSFSELKEKKYPVKLSIGRKGTSPYDVSMIVLDAYGITPEDIESWGGKVYRLIGARSATMMADGLLEGLLQGAGCPYPAIDKLSKTRELKLITPTEPEIMPKLKEQGLIPGVIPAGTYNFVNEDMPTAVSNYTVFCRQQATEEEAYYVTKAIWDQRDLLRNSYRGFKRAMTEEKVRNFVQMFESMLHPGARRYWKEQGMLK